jgi:hypothetical protein
MKDREIEKSFATPEIQFGPQIQKIDSFEVSLVQVDHEGRADANSYH